MPSRILVDRDDLGPKQGAQERLPLEWEIGAPANRRAMGQHLRQAWLTGVVPAVRLLSPGEIHEHALRCRDLDEEVALIGSQLAVSFEGTEASRRRMQTEIARFIQRLHKPDISGIADVTEQHVEDFIHEAVPQGNGWSPPAVATMHGRRWAVRFLVRTARQLHIVDAAFDPTIDIVLPPRTTLTNRPLTDEEELAGRFAATGTGIHTRRPAAWALGQATAVAGELLRAEIRDLDLPGCRVWLHGTAHRHARWGALTDWGVAQLAERVEHLRTEGHGEDAPLVRSPGSTYRSCQTQSCNAISETLKLAQLSGEPDISPQSLPNWRGRQVFDQTGNIDEAAETLGIESLDTTALAINWNWRRR